MACWSLEIAWRTDGASRGAPEFVSDPDRANGPYPFFGGSAAAPIAEPSGICRA